MKIKYSEERFMTILWDIYNRTTNGRTMTSYKELCKDHNVTISVFPILVKHKVLDRVKLKSPGRGNSHYTYTWNTIQPNIYMAQKLMNEIIRCNKESNERHMLKKKQKLAEQQIFEHVEIPEQPWQIIEMPVIEESVVEAEQVVLMKNKKGIFEEVEVKQEIKEVQQEVKQVEKPQRVISIGFGLILIKW